MLQIPAWEEGFGEMGLIVGLNTTTVTTVDLLSKHSSA